MTYRSMTPTFWLVALAFGVPPVTYVHACPYSIRDSAFIGSQDPPSYNLYFVVDRNAPIREELTEWVELAADAWLGDAATKARVMDRVDARSHRLEELLPARSLDPARLPIAVLVSPQEDATIVPGFGPGNVSQDAVMDAVVSVVESPARIDLREHLIESWCAVLIVEGKDLAENARAEKAIRAAIQRITGTTTEMGKVVTTGPYLYTVSPDDVNERLFLWSLGLAEPDADTTTVRATMLVGRSERRGPIFAGAEITADSLYDAFVMLGRSCSCTTAEMWLTGPIPPLDWGPEMQDAVSDELGFDPRDPEAVRSIRNVVAGIRGPTGFGGSTAFGYHETYIEMPSASLDLSIRVTDVGSTADALPTETIGGTASADNTEIAEPDTASLTAPPLVSVVYGAEVTQTSNWSRPFIAMIGAALVAVAAITLVIVRRTRAV